MKQQERAARAKESEDEGSSGEGGRLASIKADLEKVASGASLAMEVAGLKSPTHPLGKKRMVVSGALSFLFGPIGWLYAAPLKEAIPAIVVYVAAIWLLGLVLPSILLVWPLAIVNVLSGAAGALYAWGFNSAGKRVPLVLKESDEAPIKKLR